MWGIFSNSKVSNQLVSCENRVSGIKNRPVTSELVPVLAATPTGLTLRHMDSDGSVYTAYDLVRCPTESGRRC